MKTNLLASMTAVLVLTFAWTASAVPRTWDSTSGYWTNEAKWGGTAPQAGDAVTLPVGSYTVTLDIATFDLTSYTQNGGTLMFTNWDTCLRATEVTINSGRLDHAICNTNAAPGITNRVYVIATNVTVAGNGQINVHRRGFPGGPTGNTYGQGPGGAYGAAGGWAGGGGHGGTGGSVGYGGVVNDDVAGPVYPGSGGGSRGNSAGEIGGGCVRIDATDRVTVDGTIRASGGDGTGYNGGGAGGSIWISCGTFTGTGLLNADGGKGDSYNGGGGGGGRIALTYNPGNQAASGLSPTVQYSLNSGTGKSRGDAGTLYLLDDQCLPYHWPGGAAISFGAGVTSLTKTYSDMQFSNGPVMYPDMPISLTVVSNVVLTGTAYPDGVTFGSNTTLAVGGQLTIRNALFVAGTNLAVTGSVSLNASSASIYSHSNRPAVVTCGGDFTMTTNSRLYVYAADTNASFPEYGALVDIASNMVVGPANCWIYPGVWNSVNTNKTLGAVLFRMNNLMVSSNSGFNADSGGYAGARTNYSWYGLGPGGGKWADNPSGGGGYGGAGAAADAIYGRPYGSVTNSNRHGSGGGMGESRGLANAAGAGGGVIWIQAAGNVTMDGTLRADGGQSTDATYHYSGGGSGGGILVQAAGSFSGATGSLLSAKGGDSYTYDGGGGGGGRIAIWRKVPADLRDQISREEAPKNRYETAGSWPEFEGTVSVTGGEGKSNGFPGTVLFLTGIPVQGTLVIIR